MRHGSHENEALGSAVVIRDCSICDCSMRSLFIVYWAVSASAFISPSAEHLLEGKLTEKNRTTVNVRVAE